MIEPRKRSHDKIGLDLSTYSRIIIYGAGWIGKKFLSRFKGYILAKNKIGRPNELGILSKIEVWDERYYEIRSYEGFPILKPDFTYNRHCEDVLIIIALSSKMNFDIVCGIAKKFDTAGYKNTIVAEKFMSLKFEHNFEEVSHSSFNDNSYADCAYQANIDFSDFSSSVKPIAFYLPQFHEIPENSEWWGKGFTEWTNVKKAQPNFDGHYQPREPHDDIGYYDLSEVESIRKQAKIAREHGIYGWCVYHYWFSGKKLLTKPLELLMENKDIDINFCLLWVNEPWSKNWVGDAETVLIDNEYTAEDPEMFIDDFKKYTEDERYIRIDGKPVIMIYRILNIPNLRDVIKRWREHALKNGIGEITVMSVIWPWTLKDLDLSDCIDKETDFIPGWHMREVLTLTNGPNVTMYYYKNFIDRYIREDMNDKHSAYLSCLCGYDNTPRYGANASILSLGFRLRDFYKMVRAIAENAKKYNKEYMFIFAWNEWAETAYLEPDKKYGYALINTFSKALYGLPIDYVPERKIITGD